MASKEAFLIFCSSSESWESSDPMAKQTIILQQEKELSSVLNQKNATISTPKLSSSSSEPRNRRKRRRTSENPSFQWTDSSVQKNFGHVEGLQQSRKPFNMVKKRVSRIQGNLSNFDSVASSVNSSAPRPMLHSLVDYNIGNKEEKFDGLSKEIDDAITRIESLIPALQRLVSSVGDSNVGNQIGRSKDVEIATSNLIYGATMFSKCNNPVSLPVNVSHNSSSVSDNVQHQTIFLNDNTMPRREESKLRNEIMQKSMVDNRMNWVSNLDDGGGGIDHSIRNKSLASFDRNLEFEKNLQRQRSQLSRGKSKNIMHRSDSLKHTKTQHLYKDTAFGSLTQVPSVGSINHRIRPNRTGYVRKSDCKWSISHSSGRTELGNVKSSKIIQFRDGKDRKFSTRKNISDALRIKNLRHHQEPDDSSWDFQQSDPLSSSSRSYESSSTGSYDSYDCCDSEHGKLNEASESTTYGTSSYYSSTQDPYLDAGRSTSESQSSGPRSRKWDPQLERGKRVGRLRKLKKKLGMTFHHHHHHHHHYSESDESDHVGHVRSFWKRIGKMFHRTKKSDREKQKAEKTRKEVIKRMPKKKKQQGHFHALVEALMRHVRHTKKSKQANDGFRRLGNSYHVGGKKANTKLPFWPNNHKGRGGVKLTNKGRVKLGTRKRRPQLAAATKMILRQ